MFVTYLTVYSGEKLPPFYIGSTTEERLAKGYHGSIRSVKYRAIWEQEIIDHPELFETRILTSHDAREDSLIKEEEIQKMFDAVKSPLFTNMAYARGGFINPGSFSDETRAKMSASAKAWRRGEKIVKAPRSGPQTQSPETRKKMSLAHLDRWAKMSPEEINLISEKKSKPRSEDVKINMRSLAAQRKALLPIKPPKEPKSKKVRSIEANQNISKALLGHSVSEGTRMKIGNANKLAAKRLGYKGKTQSPEQVAKRVASRKQTLMLKRINKEVSL